MISERGQMIKEFVSSGDYSLKSGVFLVNGSSRCAIYDINTSDEGFWKKLTGMGLATLNEEKRKPILPELLRKPSLQFVWFEVVSNDCNESCIHCYAECMPPAYRKAVGLMVEKDSKN